MTRELNRMDALSCLKAFGRKEFSPAELVSACLARIEEREETVRAWKFLDRQIIDAQLKQLESLDVNQHGPLHGLPVGVKDIYDTAEMPTGYGSQIYEGHQPVWDAASVAHLRAAGAIILGKTVSTEFAYWKAGKTCNPHDTSRSPGGSSSGSAAGVADFMMPLAVGSQTVASVMRPAAFCGVVGFKPSFGRISVAGIKPFAGSLDTVGTLARTVSDAALIASVMARRDDWSGQGAESGTPSLRLARTPDWSLVTAEGISAVETAATRLQAEGAKLVDSAAPDMFASLSGAQNTVLAYEAAREYASEWHHHRDRLSSQIVTLIEEGLSIPPDAYEQALAQRMQALCSIEDLFDGADILLAPSAVGEAPLLKQGTGDPIMSRAWTFLGLPSISLPCGTGPSGLPLGLQIAARPGKDREVIAAAQWIEPRLV